jgi:hypothetical protein
VADLSWRTHLLRRHPGKGVAALAVVAAALVLVQIGTGSPLLTVLGALLLVSALWPFYFPVHYRVHGEGVEIDYGLWRRRWSWDRFAAYVPLNDGIVLTPFRQSCRLERFRTLFLPCPGRVAELRSRLPPSLLCRPGRKDET